MTSHPFASVRSQSATTNLIRLAAWPFLLTSSAAILALGFHVAHAVNFFNLPYTWIVVIFFNLSYAWIVLWLFLLERRYPYRAEWRDNDGQIAADLGHTLLNKGLVQFTIVQLMGLTFFQNRAPTVLSHQPLAIQVLFGLVASEFGLYWAHRLSHEWPPLWRFHAVHHSVRRLWLVNTGRFHFVDSNISVVASLPFLLLPGISMDSIVWVSAITAYLGILTHCNVATRCGPLNYVFNTPNLHRWHHSTVITEGNANYGQNIMLWDHLFGTFFYRPNSELKEIGIAERMPRGFVAQLYVPFIWKRYQARV